MEHAAFLHDLELVPDRLRDLAAAIDDGSARIELDGLPARVVLAGMGSSWFAAQIAAARLRAAGCAAVAEPSSAAASWPDADDLLVVPISASGGSVETLQFAARYRRTLGVTNDLTSALADATRRTIPMLAGLEAGGVACRTYRHTLVVLALLHAALTGAGDPSLAARVRLAADATAALLDERDQWLPRVDEALSGGDGVWVLAPHERIGSALQGALMVREGPRRIADGCETGDWSHVDVYLTKTLRYRALVFTGSAHDGAAARWMNERGVRPVAVGPGFPGAAVEVRHRGDDDAFVRTLTEVLVPELLAARWWATASVDA